MSKLFVSYDIGGAELLSAYYVMNHRGKDVKFVCDGPAVLCFESKGLDVKIVRNNAYLRKALKTIIIENKIKEAFCSTGTSNYELDAIKEFKANGIRTSVLMEHWTNYRERFGYPDKDWKNNLPGKVMLFDDRAFEMAQSLGFPSEILIKMDNPIHKLLKTEYSHVVSKIQPEKMKFRILYLSDPLQEAAERIYNDRNGFGFTEFDVLRDIRDSIEQIGVPNIEIVIRKHSAESKNKYDKYLSSNIIILNECSLIEDLAMSDASVGCFTMALINSAILGLPSISYMPVESKSRELMGADLSHISGIVMVDKKDKLKNELENLYKNKFDFIRSEGGDA